MQEVIANLMQLSSASLDPYVVKKMRAWPDPVPAIAVLEVLDDCAHGALASGFVMTVLDIVLQNRMKAENTTMDELVKLAHWRSQSA